MDPHRKRRNGATPVMMANTRILFHDSRRGGVFCSGTDDPRLGIPFLYIFSFTVSSSVLRFVLWNEIPVPSLCLVLEILVET